MYVAMLTDLSLLKKMTSGGLFQDCYQDLPQKSSVKKKRIVPAFTIQALQKNVVVEEPPKSGVLDERKPKQPTKFREFYERGELPMTLEFGSTSNKIHWKNEEIDYSFYLPLLFEGLCETEYPCDLLVQHGIDWMLLHGGNRILPIIPQLIVPIKKALNTHNPLVLSLTCNAIQKLVMSAPGVGEALVPYYRQILPVFELFKNSNKIPKYKGNFPKTVGDYIQDTLVILERYGGEDAFLNIKYMVPTYESFVLN